MTVLGSSCSIPRPGRACSSYLVEFGRTAIVADLGTGAFARLIEHRGVCEIDAVLISHMHADHFLDLIPLRYALKYGDRPRAAKLPLYLPPGGAAMLATMTSAFHPEIDDDFLGSVFDVRAYEPDRALRIEAVDVRFAPTVHYIPTFAMRFAAQEKTIVYSADSAPSDAMRMLAENADVFVCEATLSPEAERDEPRGHSSAREAGAMAAAAKVRHLVISHYPASLDPAALERDARGAYAGRLTIADDGTIVSA